MDRSSQLSWQHESRCRTVMHRFDEHSQLAVESCPGGGMVLEFVNSRARRMEGAQAGRPRVSGAHQSTV